MPNDIPERYNENEEHAHRNLPLAEDLIEIDIPKADGWYQVRFANDTGLGDGYWHFAYLNTSNQVWLRVAVVVDGATTIHSRHPTEPIEYRGPILLDGLAELTELRDALELDRAELERRQDATRKLRAEITELQGLVRCYDPDEDNLPGCYPTCCACEYRESRGLPFA